MEEGIIFFDHHRSTFVCNEALDEEITWLKKSSPCHIVGREFFSAQEEGKRLLYESFGAKDEDLFVFCSSGQEAIQQLLFSTFFDIGKKKGKHQFIVVEGETLSPIQGILRLQEVGATLKTLPLTSSGIVNRKAFEEALSAEALLVSLSYANGQTGIIQPIEELGKLCQQKGVLFHVDGSYVFGKIPIDLSSLPVDYFSFSGEFLHGPKNSGGLFIKKGRRISPLIPEGASLRGGSFDFPAFMGLVKACKEAKKAMDFMSIEIANLRDFLEKELLNRCGAIALFQETFRLPNVALLSFPKIAAETLAYFCSKKKIYISFGGGSFLPLAEILKASSVDPLIANSALSFSLSRISTKEKIKKACTIISEEVSHLVKLSEKLL